MNRRRLLGVAAGIAGLSGCATSGEETWDEGDHFFRLGSGSEEFSGTLRVVPDCRDEAVEIEIREGEPEKSTPYQLNEDGEECSFDFYVDGEYKESWSFGGVSQGHISVNEDGEIIVAEAVT